MQPNKPPERPPRPPDVMYGSHAYETTLEPDPANPEEGKVVVRDLGPRIIHPWGPKGYQEDWEPDFSTVPDKRPCTLEKEANEILAERARRNNGAVTDSLRVKTPSEQPGERPGKNSERVRNRKMEREDIERFSGQGDKFQTDSNDDSESKPVPPAEESDDQAE